MCLYVCARTGVHVRTRTRMCTYVYLSVCACTCMHVFVCVNACVRAPALWEGEVEGANCIARTFNYRVLKGGS